MKTNRLIEQAKIDLNIIFKNRKRNKTDNILDYSTITEDGQTPRVDLDRHHVQG